MPYNKIMSFRNVKNPEEYAALVEQFLSARESLKQSVRQNKVGVSEAIYQQTQIQQPTITAIEKLEEQIQTQQQPTVSAIEKLGEKIQNANDAASAAEAIVTKEIGEESKQMDSMITDPMQKKSIKETEMERIAVFLEAMNSKRFKTDSMTVDSSDELGGLPVRIDLDRELVKVGNRKVELSLPIVELLYAPGSFVSTQTYDQETIMQYDYLTEHIPKKQLGRSSKYGLILKEKERLRKEDSQLRLALVNNSKGNY
jgi:hypothetical protein